ncbi:rhodanese-like domain-containing protein [Ferrovibrio sp.]|uniref:rhodanese-like domain-containing protein n=1 Tax=Ferrovibrio sp. TaxID=1917215 RepID=UPI003D0DBF8C
MSALPVEIEVDELSLWLESKADVALVDVREDWEVKLCALPGATHIPLGQLPGRAGEVPQASRVVVFCHHGGRSLRATQWLRANGFSQAINLAGGIHAWAERIDPDMATY